MYNAPLKSSKRSNGLGRCDGTYGFGEADQPLDVHRYSDEPGKPMTYTPKINNLIGGPGQVQGKKAHTKRPW
jgi:hypothetical protein